MPSTPRNVSGGKANRINYKKYCYKCEKYIRKRKDQSQEYPRLITLDRAESVAKYLCEKGKQCDTEDVEGKYFCNPCYLKYWKLLPKDEKKKYKSKKANTEVYPDAASTSTFTAPPPPSAEPSVPAFTGEPTKNSTPDGEQSANSGKSIFTFFYFICLEIFFRQDKLKKKDQSACAITKILK